ncbi:MAG: CPBP family intramembrane metalloprotease domain-containing protein, partial [Actinomycetes bacterium]|nr:CPBP family intramembrane metalloprotease domain-containing protein [Actinomycetes bacterium]MDX5380637.1 CPBP family intramembrane metalloprotease domain-containing protein [Actinomycetes bacterium]MDX5399589.1 CPBP family intramembrane metalloprotease domain-containing protein [Actinomycetes bacterium]MDX5450377.1 CPBP family intramembrane metalloprotease domain-containing protein [Actinomycetes bacterium]
GLVFNEYYRRSRRVMPLVVAHTLIDVVAFVGWWAIPEAWRAFLV